MCPPPPKKKKKKKLKNEKFGKKQWEIRAKAIGNFGQKQWEMRKKQKKIRVKAMEIREKAIIFARKICAAFRVFSLLLPKFSDCFCPNLPVAFARICHCFSRNLGKSNGNILAKAMRKLEKRRIYISDKNYGSFGKFHEFTYYFQNTS